METTQQKELKAVLINLIVIKLKVLYSLICKVWQNRSFRQ